MTVVSGYDAKPADPIGLRPLPLIAGEALTPRMRCKTIFNKERPDGLS